MVKWPIGCLKKKHFFELELSTIGVWCGLWLNLTVPYISILGLVLPSWNLPQTCEKM